MVDIRPRRLPTSVPTRPGSTPAAKSIFRREAAGSLGAHADVARCSCARCATTRPTPRSRATACSSGPGYIRRVSAGIYSWLPLGYRVLRKVEQIVREEMDAAGAQEVLLPIVQPLELWERSGRDKAYGPLMFRLARPQGDRLLPLADGRGGGHQHRRPGVRLVPRPAGEPVPDQLEVPRRAAAALRPAARPRVPDEGRVLLRRRPRRPARELPADVRRVPPRVRRGAGSRSARSRRESGEMGGDESHEFMAVAAVGEDDFVWCPSCDYAANVEAARRGATPTAARGAGDAAADGGGAHARRAGHRRRRRAPGRRAGHAAEVRSRSTSTASSGSRSCPATARSTSSRSRPRCAPKPVRLYGDDDFAAHPELPKGYIGPHFPGVERRRRRPERAAPASAWVTGANERRPSRAQRGARARLRRRRVGRHRRPSSPGDPCPRCGKPLSIDRGIEVGHVFQLGDEVREALDARYTDENGEQHPMVMGCYGIGVSRVVAAVAEEHHDEHGLAWPAALAPYARAPHRRCRAGASRPATVVAEADRVYDELRGRGRRRALRRPRRRARA